MNILLAELARAKADQTLIDDEIHRRSLSLLEWDAFKTQLARRCRTSDGVAAVLATRPFTNVEVIEGRRDLAAELRPAEASDPWPPLADISIISEVLGTDEALRLEGSDLNRIGAAAVDMDILRDYFLSTSAARPLWMRGVGQLGSFRGLSTLISRALDSDGRIRDDASPRLSRLRKDLHKGEASARSAVARIMETASAKGWTNGPEITMRGDRFCIPLHANSKRKVQGLVHDRSSTGGTIYVEPAEAVQVQNDLVEIRLEINAEIARIILELNSLVESQRDALLESAVYMALVDEIQAGLLWSRDLYANPALLSEDGDLKLIAARHPLLLDAMKDRDDVVPLDLEMTRQENILVVSGPNAGGKSVALKAVGLLTLISQSGWDVPAAAGTSLPLLKRICVDLGDDQSIAASLSSFSAHLSHLSDFLKMAGPGTLVLTDEIGSGTDPQEGTSLAFAVLEDLAESGSFVVASTHYGLLKAAAADHPRMINAAMEFDEESLCPLYSLRSGIPGSSHAFDIAARMELPEDILKRAQDRLGGERFQIEILLADLGRRSREMAESKEKTLKSEAEATRLEEDLRSRLSDIDGERKRLLMEARTAGERFLTEARSALEKIVREIRTSGADTKTIRFGRDTLERLGERLDSVAEDEPSPSVFQVGDDIRIPHLNMQGRIVEMRGNRIVADARGMRLTLDVQDVQTIAGKAIDNSEGPGIKTSERAGARHHDIGTADQEIDLRGYRAEEAWEALDLLIDRAIPSGLHSINIIHGIGTGRLRDYIQKKLQSDKRIATWSESTGEKGGAGRTVAEIAD